MRAANNRDIRNGIQSSYPLTRSATYSVTAFSAAHPTPFVFQKLLGLVAKSKLGLNSTRMSDSSPILSCLKG